MLERRTVLLVVKMVRNECVGELVGESPGLAREHCVDVRATRMHDRLKADCSGVSLYGWGLSRVSQYGMTCCAPLVYPTTAKG